MANRSGLSARLVLNGLEQVTVGGEMGRRIDLAIYKNFLALDIDEDFLRPFRNRRPRESLQISQRLVPRGLLDAVVARFVALGLLLDAAVLFSKYTNDEQVVSRKNYLIKEIIKTQSPDGYIGIFEAEPEEGHLWVEYCIHDTAYLIVGLAQDYRHFANQEALAAGRRLADYLMANWSKRPNEDKVTTLGTVEAFLSLYDLTGEQKYLRFAADETTGKARRIHPAALSSWEQRLYEEHNSVGCHMYRVFSRCMMQLRLYEIEPAEKLLVMSRRVLEGMTRREKAGMVITGVTSMHEYWHESQDGRERLAENCATVHQLRMLDAWMRLNGELRYGDIMERAIYNTLFASQAPDGRRIRYYTPFSGPRVYFPYDFYCCPDNFRRGMGRLSEWIYYRTDAGVAVNLYTTSEARFEMPNGLSLSIAQQTDYPTSGRAEITVKPSRRAKFAVKLRIPRWARKVAVLVNQETVECSMNTAGLVEIIRDWQAGDTIKLEMPMRWRFVKGREMQADHAALMRGPVVYCLSRKLNPGLEKLELRQITVEPDSLSEPEPDNSIRPGGLRARIKAWGPQRDLAKPPDLELILNEFPEPTGEEIYFRLPDIGAAEDDELIEPLQR